MNSKGKQFVAKDIKEKRDFSKVEGRKLKIQRARERKDRNVERSKYPLGNISRELKNYRTKESSYSHVLSPFLLLFPSLHFVPYFLIEITYVRVGGSWIVNPYFPYS
jgi:hypothetical protein